MQACFPTLFAYFSISFKVNQVATYMTVLAIFFDNFFNRVRYVLNTVFVSPSFSIKFCCFFWVLSPVLLLFGPELSWVLSPIYLLISKQLLTIGYPIFFLAFTLSLFISGWH